MTTTVMGKQLEEWPVEMFNEVKKAGRSLWLASLGVVQTVDEYGRELFAGLVERGEKLELPDGGCARRSTRSGSSGFVSSAGSKSSCPGPWSASGFRPAKT